MPLKINSSAFEDMAEIPKLYTCQGKDISAPLKWSGMPENTKSLALICDDPDAPMGTWVHWVIFNIPSQVNELPEGVKRSAKLEDGSVQGMTDFGRVGYGGTLANDHPINFEYTAALSTADGELYNPSSASGLGGSITSDMLSNNKMECSSCHDVHNTKGNSKLLLKSNQNSGLCLTCHNK